METTLIILGVVCLLNSHAVHPQCNLTSWQWFCDLCQRMCHCKVIFAARRCLGLVSMTFCAKWMLWRSALQCHTTAALCVGNFLMEGHWFKPQRSNGVTVKQATHASRQQASHQRWQAQRTHIMRIFPTKWSTCSAAVKVLSTLQPQRLPMRSKRMNLTRLKHAHAVWPAECSMLRPMNVAECSMLWARSESDSHCTQKQCNSQWTLLKIPTRKRTEMQHNPLPLSSNALRVSVALRVTRPWHAAHELWGRERAHSHNEQCSPDKTAIKCAAKQQLNLSRRVIAQQFETHPPHSDAHQPILTIDTWTHQLTRSLFSS